MHTKKLTLTKRPPRFVVGVVVTLAGSMALGGVAPAFAAAKTSSLTSAAKLQSELTQLEGTPGGGTITEAGSSLFYPLFALWSQSYTGASLQPAAGGSGAGQTGALNRTINVGASDAYLPASDPSTLLNIPVVVSAQQVNYNVPGLKKGVHLKLNGTVLNAMYTGQITNWDDPAIKKLNKGVKIPSQTIVPVHRSDSSGDTFLFSSYLYSQDSSSFVASSGGPNTTVSWPSVPGAEAGSGNTGVLQICENTPGCVAYIGVSYLRPSVVAGLGYAALKNGYTGKGGSTYQLPSPATINYEVQSFKSIPPSGTISLINGHGAKFGYPIANFEYAIVQQSQNSATTASVIKSLLAWGMDVKHGSASSFLQGIYFQPLPANALAVAIKLLNSIHS